MPILYSKLKETEADQFCTLCLKKDFGLLILLSIFKKDNLSKNIHDSFIETLLKLLSSKNIIKNQILSEMISWFLINHKNSINIILNYLKNAKPSPCYCFLISSLSQNNNLPDVIITEILSKASNLIMNQKLTNFVFHYLASLYDKKSNQLITLMVGEQQCKLFINYLNNPKINISPYSINLLSTCVIKLLPILMPLLPNDIILNTIILLINSFYNLPSPFTKEFFYTIYKYFLHYLKNNLKIFQINYPISRKASCEYKLITCELLVELSNISPLTSMEKYIPDMFVLLQRTRDLRVEKCILVIANSFNYDNFDLTKMKQWISFSKQILSGNSTPGFEKSFVEANITVKSCALHIIYLLLPSIAKSEPLSTDCLDDLLSSTIHSIETKRVEIYQISYQILTKVIDLFRFTKKEGQNRLLDLYESLFLIASRYAFLGDIDFSCNFLASYIDFYYDEFKYNPDGFMVLVDICIKGIQSVPKTNGFIYISSKLCSLSRICEPIFSRCKNFLGTLLPLFTKFILESIKIRTGKPNYSELSQYEMRVAPFYKDILSLFVWLETKYPNYSLKQISPQIAVSFFLYELLKSSESWRIYAGFMSLSRALQYWISYISFDVVVLIITECCNSILKNNTLLEPLVSEFLYFGAKFLKKEEKYQNVWDSLAVNALRYQCTAETICLIIINAYSNESILKFVDYILKKVKENKFSEEETTCLVTIIYDSFPETIPSVVKRIYESKNLSIKFQMKIYLRALLRTDNIEIIDKLSYFCSVHIKEGGLKLVGTLLIKKPNLGFEIVGYGIGNKAYEEIETSIDDAKISLLFFDLLQQKLKDEPVSSEISIEICKAALHAIIKWSGDKKRGKEISELSIKLIKDSELINTESLKEAFDFFNEVDLNNCFNTLNNMVKSSLKQPKKISLKLFSKNVRNPHESDGDWEILD